MENILLNDQEAERALEMEYNITGCLLMDTERTLKTIRNLISAEDFQNDTCRAIYLASLDLYSSGKPLDYGLIQDRAIELGYSIDLGISRQVRLCYTTTANAEPPGCSCRFGAGVQANFAVGGSRKAAGNSEEAELLCSLP